MSDIEERKKFILEQVGEEALGALKASGVNVDLAVTSILREQEKKREIMEFKTAIPTVDNTMTSELAYLSDNIKDNFGQEYVRRLKLIGLPNNDISSLYHQESIIAASGNMGEQRKQQWVRRDFIMHDSTPDTMPKPEGLTLSELILITDDANSAFCRDHHVLPDQAWAALCIASCYAQYTEARYMHAFDDRTEKLGWSKAQNRAYTRNECLLAERFKWGQHEKPAWTKETTDLKQFER